MACELELIEYNDLSVATPELQAWQTSAAADKTK